MFVDRSIRTAAASLLGLVLASALALAHAAGTEVGVAQSEAHGAYLVDAEGMSLYVYLRDSDGESDCYYHCADAWPPLLTDDTPIALEGVDVELLGTTERTDGSVQVTYAGWPLYTFGQDEGAGDVAGQGVNDIWFLVSPAGEPIGADVASDDDDDTFAAFMELGERVYAQQCAVCHGAQGNQALVSHAAILDGYRRLNDSARMIRAIVNGRGYMPGLGGVLTDEEVAAVATFVRNSWSNDHGIVSVEEVEAVR